MADDTGLEVSKAILELRVKPKNRRLQRELKKRQPKVHERIKKAVILRGTKTSQVISNVLKDFTLMKKPDVKTFSRREHKRPWEDASSIEFYSDKNDSSLFCYGSHSKKRAHSLTMARTFNHQILDMIEFRVDPITYKPTGSYHFPGGTWTAGKKPMFVFNGSQWETDAKYTLARNIIVDYCRGYVIEKLNYKALEHVISCTAIDEKIYWRTYRTSLIRSASQTPYVKLEPCGPEMDLTIAKIEQAPKSLQDAALKKPKQANHLKKTKNIEFDGFGHKHGKIHMGSQNLNRVNVMRFKGLKKKKKKKKKAMKKANLKQSADRERKRLKQKKSKKKMASKKTG